jgi:sortase B
MFSDLHEFKKLDFYKENPVFTFDTLYEEAQYKIFSVFYMAGNQSDEYFYYYLTADFPDDEAFLDHARQLKARSIFKTTVEVDPEDQIVILTCCTYETDNLRLGVAARKVRDSESTEVDVDAAALAESPIYPRKWYDQRGGKPVMPDWFVRWLNTVNAEKQP